MQKRFIPMILVVAVVFSGLFSLFSIHGLQGNARVINYSGVVRGATQRLVKKELEGYPDNRLVARLDALLQDLAAGDSENGLERIDDEQYQMLVSRMQEQWKLIKEQISLVRDGGDPDELYELSETYFGIADDAVSAAEAYSERQVDKARLWMLVLNAGFLLLAAFLAWYESVQTKRQRAMEQTESANREQSRQLENLARDLRAPMDEISELMYVADPETYDLLFINEMGRKTFGVWDLEGLKCYQVLQGRDTPCEFCTTPKLVSGENYTWEFTNPITKKHYLLKDRLIQWGGQTARMEIAFDMTQAQEEKQALKNTLDAQEIIMECVRTLYQEHDMSRSVSKVLRRIGEFLQADRAYLFIERGGLLYNDFEWCSQGVAPQREYLQGLPPSAIDCWRPAFDRQQCAVIEDVESLRDPYPEAYSLLYRQGIHSLVAAPLEQDGRLRGSLGVDNPPPERIRSISSLLQTLCYFLMLTFRRTENEQQLSQLSYFDTLTSFYNRNRFMEDSEALAGTEQTMGVVYLDVNGLKDINDRQGHAQGDKVLAGCARQMREVFGQANYYRIGGDEFVILCPGIGRQEFEWKVEQLRGRFSSGTVCNAAIGAQWDTQFQSLQQSIARADEKMYEDKKDFYRKNPLSNRYRSHSDEMIHLLDPKVLQDEIREKRFVIYLQPQISSSDRTVVGAEALVRYQSRSGSLVLPGNFLPLLEKTQTISQLDFYVVELACAQLRDWASQGKPKLPLAVNFSRCSLSQPDFVEKLIGICEKYGVERQCLEVEITETARESDSVDFKALICRLRRSGFVVSIDDFGTQYANLALLSTVDFDALKLDKTLVDHVADSPKARTVVESIVSVCQKNQIKVVAEGIESEEQLSVLQSCGVQLAQGFLFSKPIPTKEYEEKYLQHPVVPDPKER